MLLIPLYGRKMAMDLYPDLFSDGDCQGLFDSIDFVSDSNKRSPVNGERFRIVAVINPFPRVPHPKRLHQFAMKL